MYNIFQKHSSNFHAVNHNHYIPNDSSHAKVLNDKKISLKFEIVRLEALASHRRKNVCMSKDGLHNNP